MSPRVLSSRSPYAASVLTIAVFLYGCESAAPPQPATTATTGESLEKFEFVQPKMGTVFRIVLYAPDRQTAEKAAAAAFARVDELNRTLSDYDPNSELSRLSQQTNDGPMARPVHVGDDLWRVLERGVEASKLSDGAFDVTVGPFVRLWRRSRDLKELPTPERIEAARQAVGYQHLKLDPQNHTVQLLAPRMRLDVGGIAKGYTAQESMAVLNRFGIRRAVVGAAGDLAVGDPPPGRTHWRIGIQSLQRPDDVAGYVQLRNAGISTSGDTYRYVEIGGKRYSHIIDPKTGLGLTDRIGVTLIAPDSITSDWLSTAISILGPQKGLALVERMPGTAVRIVTVSGTASATQGTDGEKGGDRGTVFESSRFKDYGFEPAEPGRSKTPDESSNKPAATFPAPDLELK